MKAKAISHIAVCVRDLDKSLAFYRDILGMTVNFDAIQDTRGGSRTQTYKHQRETRRVAHCEKRLTPLSGPLFLPLHLLVKKGWTFILGTIESCIGICLLIQLTWNSEKAESTDTKDMQSERT